MYFKQFPQRFPLFTKCLFSGSVFAISDYIAQSYKKQKIDLHSLYRFTSYGILFQAPFLHSYLPWLERSFPNIEPKLFGPNLFKKLLFDQLITAPLSLIVFIIYNNFDFKNFLIEKPLPFLFKEEWKELCIANWTVWPTVNLLTFSIVPLDYRLYFINSIGLLWTIYLCWSLERVKK